MESTSENVVKTISDIYKNKIITSNNSNSFIYVIIIFIFVFIYLIIEFNRQAILLDWKNNKCNPRYMFISGMIQNEVQDGVQYTYDNFLECTRQNETVSNAIKSVYENTTKLDNNADNAIKNINLMSENLDISMSETNKTSLNNQTNINNISTTMDLLYTQHTKLYNIMKMYIDRTLYIVNNIYDYIANVLYYKLNTYKKELDIDNFNSEIIFEYNNIIDTDVSSCYNYYNNGDYYNCIQRAASATDRLNKLKNRVKEYTNNTSEKIDKTKKIDKICRLFDDSNISQINTHKCTDIFSNYNLG